MIVRILLCLLTVGTLVAQDDVATGPGSTPVGMRVVGAIRTVDSLHIRVLLSDSNGAMVRLLDGVGSWTVNTRCRAEDGASRAPTPVRVSEVVVDDVPAACMVVLNNSLIEGGYPRTALAGLSAMLRRMPDKDSIGVMSFDEGSNIIAPLSSPALAADALAVDIGNPDGLGAVYSALSSALSAVSTHVAGPRAIVLITSSDDNASVVHTPADIVRRAREQGVAIHIVRIGANAQGYVYRYIAHATGGRLTTIDPASVEEVGTIVRDVVKGMHRYHSLGIGVSSETVCSDLWVYAGFTAADRQLNDSILIPLRDRAYRLPSIVVATFPDDEDASLRRSYNTLATLSEAMLSDPSMNVELIGHSSPTTGKEASTKGLRRAQAVADLLVAYGVPKERIRVRTEGSSRPMYYFQQSEAHRALNNRVEMRWLVADDAPYTVTAEELASEEQASKAIEKWEARGFKAYFDPVVTTDGPSYRIRLWGYATYAEAQRAAKAASKKYKAKASAD